jgi:hypothetical protein
MPRQSKRARISGMFLPKVLGRYLQVHKDPFVVGLCNLIWATMKRRISSARTRRTITTAKASVHNHCSGVENSHPDNVRHVKYLTFFFPATSFYPGRGQDVDAVFTQQYPSRIHPKDDNLPILHDGDSDVETEEDWLSGPHPEEPAGRMSSKSLEVMRVEVSPSLILFLLTYKYFCSVQSGRALQLKQPQQRPTWVASQLMTWQPRRRPAVAAALPPTQ